MVLNASHLVPRNTFLIWSRWHFFYSPSLRFNFHSLPFYSNVCPTMIIAFFPCMKRPDERKKAESRKKGRTKWEKDGKGKLLLNNWNERTAMESIEKRRRDEMDKKKRGWKKVDSFSLLPPFFLSFLWIINKWWLSGKHKSITDHISPHFCHSLPLSIPFLSLSYHSFLFPPPPLSLISSSQGCECEANVYVLHVYMCKYD